MSAQTKAAGLKIKVLLIEDNPGDAHLIRLQLHRDEEAVFHVEHADHLAAGLGRLAAERYDLLLLDLSLPDSKGLGTYHKVHAAAPETPTVVLTGNEDEDVAPLLLREGVQRYLVKGDTDDSLLRQSVRHAIERKHAQNAMRESEMHIRKLIESNADGIVIVDREGIVRFANPAAEALFGYTKERFVGSPFGFPAAAGERVEIELYRGKQKPVIAEMRVAEVEWESEVAWLASIRDITERKEMEDRLAETARKLSETVAQLESSNATIIEQQKSAIEEERLKVLLEMAGATAHEMNQPLSVLLGYIEMLPFVEGDHEGTMSCLAEIESAGRKIAEVVHKIQSLRHYDIRPYAGGSCIVNLEQHIDILSVEDSDRDYQSLTGIIKGMGQVSCTRASSLREAMEAMQQRAFDMVLFDYYLPDGNAIEALQEMRREEVETPVVVITGKGNEIIASQTVQEGAYDCLPKSRLTRASLTRSIGNALSKARLKSEIKLAQQKLRDMAVLDDLTGLHNRRYFLDSVGRELARDRRYKHGLVLGLMDLDHFKDINDKYGHATGDMVLQEIGRMISGCFRECDIYCRWGGEEFAVILPNCHAEMGLIACERLRKMLDTHTFCFGNLSFRTTVSIGIVEYDRVESSQELIQRADEALNAARKAGRNRVVIGGCSLLTTGVGLYEYGHPEA